METKPELHILSKPYDANEVARIFTKITGKEVPPEKLAEMQKQYDDLKNKQP